MRRPRAITLVLLGTAAVSLGACESQEARCRRARAEGRPDAAAVCAGGSSSSSGSHSWFGWSGGRSGSTTAGDAGAATARGGFGGTAAAHSAGG